MDPKYRDQVYCGITTTIRVHNSFNKTSSIQLAVDETYQYINLDNTHRFVSFLKKITTESRKFQHELSSSVNFSKVRDPMKKAWKSVEEKQESISWTFVLKVNHFAAFVPYDNTLQRSIVFSLASWDVYGKLDQVKQ